MIDFIKKIELGGFLQKIHCKGDNEKNPVLLVLHGGPGIPNRGSFLDKHEDLCRDFIVVTWDQRGSGGSYKNIDRATLTLDQFIQDAKELIDYLKTETGQKIYLLCGSWGSELGTYLCWKHPENIAGYIGFGQVVSGWENERLSYDFAYNKAEEASDYKSLEILKRYGPPVKGIYKEGLKGLVAQRRIMTKYGGYSANKGGFIKMFVWPILKSREYNIEDKIGILMGYKLVLSTMWPQITDYDFAKEKIDFKMPYYIFQGVLDNNTPSALIDDYYSSITAPKKELVWFEKSGHNPLNDEPELFKKLIKEKFL